MACVFAGRKTKVDFFAVVRKIQISREMSEEKSVIRVTGGRIPTRNERLPEQRITTHMEDSCLCVSAQWLFELRLGDSITTRLTYLEKAAPHLTETTTPISVVNTYEPRYTLCVISAFWKIEDQTKEDVIIRVDSMEEPAFWMQLRVPKNHAWIKTLASSTI